MGLDQKSALRRASWLASLLLLGCPLSKRHGAEEQPAARDQRDATTALSFSPRDAVASELDKAIIKETNAEIAAVLVDIDAGLRDGFRAIDPGQLPSPLMSQTRDWRSKVLLPGAEGDPKDIQ